MLHRKKPSYKSKFLFTYIVFSGRLLKIKKTAVKARFQIKLMIRTTSSRSCHFWTKVQINLEAYTDSKPSHGICSVRVSISSLALCPSLELLTRFKYNIGFNLQKALGQSILIVLAFLQHAQKPLRRGKHPMKRESHIL